MQESSDNKFDRFINSKMEEVPFPKATEQDWNNMESQLSPSPNSFLAKTIKIAKTIKTLYSVPMAATIAATAVVATVAVIHFKENVPETKEQKNIQDTTSIYKENPDSLKSIQEENKNTIELLPELNTKKENNSDIQKTNSSSVPEITVDTSTVIEKMPVPIQVDPQVTSSDSIVKPKPKVKKIKYVTKRDTIVSADTTKIKRKR